MQQEFECRICIPAPEESAIRVALERALPSFRWGEGDSSWDKIRVWGERPDAAVTVYRYESPGPFRLTIRAVTDEAHRALRDQVLVSLQARIWKPLEPRQVELIEPHPAYAFDCDLSLSQIYDLLADADFWYWELLGRGARYIDGRIPFQKGRRVRITGDRPTYKLEMGHWPGASDPVYEIVQTTILPALGARNVRAAS